jgi:hypothetical protein
MIHTNNSFPFNHLDEELYMQTYNSTKIYLLT